MKILKRFREPGEQWQEESEEDCIRRTEGAGYYKHGTVIDMLKAGQEVSTFWAVYKAYN